LYWHLGFSTKERDPVAVAVAVVAVTGFRTVATVVETAAGDYLLITPTHWWSEMIVSNRFARWASSG
jgi:hypothetical protein